MAKKLPEVDVLIVGLGWTGGILAKELTAAGHKVVALERGAMRTPEVQEVYLQHGFGGPLDPVRLKSEQIVNLALDLQAFEVNRRQGQKLAS